MRGTGFRRGALGTLRLHIERRGPHEDDIGMAPIVARLVCGSTTARMNVQ